MSNTKEDLWSDPAYISKVTSIIVLGGFISVFSASIINVTLPEIQIAFGVNIETVKWVVTINLVAISVLMPITGYLRNRLGVKNVMIISLIFFTLGSFLCGIAWNMDSLLVYRVIQGIGGGLLWPMSMAIITIVFPPEQRGRGMAFYGMGTSMGGTAGPAVGGYMVDNFSWRLIFYINVILGVAGLVACLTILKSDQDRVKERFDYLGFITLSFLIVSLLVALSQGNVKGWNSYYTLGLFLIFIASFSAWIYTESIVARPLIDLGIFRNKHFMVGTIVSFMVGICLFGSNFLMPLFMARLLDYSIFRISLALVPGVLLSIFTTRIGGFLTDAFSPRLPTILGLILWALFAYAFSLMDMRASFVVITLVILLRGSGLGLSYTPSMTGAMLSLPTRFLAVAAGLLSLAFTLGGMFGIAILGTMLENRELTHYSNYTENYDQTSYAAGQALNSLQSFFAGLGHTGAEAKGLAIGLLRGMVSVEAVVSAFQDSFILLSITALATIGIAVFLHKK